MNGIFIFTIAKKQSRSVIKQSIYCTLEYARYLLDKYNCIGKWTSKYKTVYLNKFII